MKDYQEYLNKEHEERIKDLESHAGIANREMGIVKTDIKWVKTQMWGVITALAAILFKLFVK